VQEFILRIKKRKATGYDGIQAEVQKVFYIIRDKIEILTNIVNKIKNESEIPRDWKICNYVLRLLEERNPKNKNRKV
jgi:hypothetical protein